MHWILTVFVALIVLLFTFVVYLNFFIQKRVNQFKKNGIPYVGTRFLENLQFLTGYKNIVEMEEGLYQDSLKYKSPVVVTSDFLGQFLVVVTDVNLLRNILVKDFDHFFNRRPIQTKQTSKLFNRFLFSSSGERWKGLRTLLSPTFTTGKIRRMFQLFQTSSSRMDVYLKAEMDRVSAKSVDFDFSKIFAKYAMDVIASSAFGIDSKSWNYPPEQLSYFEEMGKRFGFKFTGKFLLRFLIVTVAPKLADLLGIEIMDHESQSYFVNVIKQVIQHRRATREKRVDFLQLMLDAQEGLLKADEESNEVMNGRVEGDRGQQSGDLMTVTQAKINFEDDDIIANSLVFFMAGFDPTQTVLLFTLYSLALEPEVQEKLHKEVDNVLKKYKGEFSYDAVSEMTYLEMVVNESMRVYPPATRTERFCTKDWTVPGTDILIKQGSVLLIPIHGIHQDPEYFDNPKKFIPERFSAENKAARNPYTHLPFGHGPRNCIGMRFALVKVKTAIAQLVHSFRLTTCGRTQIPMDFDRNASVKPKGGMWLNLTSRD